VGHQRRVGPDRGQGGGLDLELQGGRQPDGPDHPQRVLAEPRVGVADGAQHPPVEVREAAEWIHERVWAAVAGGATPGDGVDGEVTAGEVGDDVLAELHPVRPAEVRVLVLGAEGGDLVDVGVAADRHRPEPVLVDRAVEERDEVFREGVGGEGPVGGLAAAQGVAQGPSHDVRGVAGRVQVVEDIDHRGGDEPREPLRGGVRSGHGAGQFRPRKR
jgi:hypothetical protein